MFAIIVFVLVLGILILVHELGHFIAAKKAGCDVQEFGIGFPPRLFTIKRGGTTYSFNLLPIGGFVKIKGEDGGDKDDPGSFASKGAFAKSVIILAGVLMNIVLAYVFISIVLFIGVPSIDSGLQDLGRFAKVSDKNVRIMQVIEASPAALSGIEPGDRVMSVNGQNITIVTQLQEVVKKNPDQQLELQIKRKEEIKSFYITPQLLADIDSVGIGVGLSESAIVSYPWYIAPFVGFTRTFEILWLIIVAFKDLFVQLVSTGEVGADVAGPIGIAVLTAEVADLGFVHILQFTALLSLNLAIINALPFPALDGSRILFILIEKIRRKKMRINTERWVHVIGFGLLMLLMVAVTIQDISRYGASIWSHITSFFS